MALATVLAVARLRNSRRCTNMRPPMVRYLTVPMHSLRVASTQTGVSQLARRTQIGSNPFASIGSVAASSRFACVSRNHDFFVPRSNHCLLSRQHQQNLGRYHPHLEPGGRKAVWVCHTGSGWQANADRSEEHTSEL